MSTTPTPVLFTFDGQARSGKGTIAHAVKRSLQARDMKTMLIDAGQVFRVLVVSATKHGVNVDSPDEIDAFLADDKMLDETTDLIKKVYAMDHEERDELIYTHEVGANSAKIAARPKSQEFKDDLLKKWYKDAGDDGYHVILHDGRALEETGMMLQDAGLCDYRKGFFFTCNPSVGARRTLGLAEWSYDEITDEEKHDVDTLVEQIIARNKSDAERTVQPVLPPENAPTFSLTEFGDQAIGDEHRMMIIDTSDELGKDDMVQPFIDFFDRVFQLDI
jgi:cytidylate kinase